MQTSIRQTLIPTTVVLVLVLAWEASRLDLPLAQMFGSQHGFPWRDHWLFATALHDWGRVASWTLAVALAIGVWWPWGDLRQIDTSHRLQLAVTGLASAAAVALVKSSSTTSCPWDLAEFGGLAHYVPHWDWWAQDGGSGHCFPAGHASSGFAFIGAWFAFRQRPALAWRWLWAALAAGLVFGLAQQVRGAHFMSHTLWSGWLCWLVGWGIDLAWPVTASEVAA
nr:hypothetical protein [uncultured bacterium]